MRTDALDCSTLGYMLKNNDRLFVICMNGPCSHGAELNVQWLADLLGPDHSSLARDIIASLKRKRKRLRCTTCGSTNISFRIIPGCFTGYRG
nr:hypothetical protein [uncultured Cohaesibacter sp.]